jgi:hypothetical protein
MIIYTYMKTKRRSRSARFLSRANDGGKPKKCPRDSYESPFCTRYASREMQYLFSPDKKFRTWRRLWIALAKAEKQLGPERSPTSRSPSSRRTGRHQLRRRRARERQVRHDVMSHVYAYGVQCPEGGSPSSISARPPATSATIPISSSCARRSGWCAARSERHRPAVPISRSNTARCPALPTPTCSPRS